VIEALSCGEANKKREAMGIQSLPRSSNRKDGNRQVGVILMYKVQESPKGQRKEEEERIIQGRERKEGLSRLQWVTEVTHGTTTVASVEDPRTGLGSCISNVDGCVDVLEHNVAFTHPLLNSKPSDINMANTGGRSDIVAHMNSGLVVFMEDSGFRLGMAKLSKDRTKVLGDLGGLNSSDQLSFSAGSGDSWLKFGFVVDSTTAKHVDHTSNGFTSL